jgi:glutamyl-tRNA synthetase
MGIKEDAYRYAIKNAALHNGKADIGAVVGKIKALDPTADVKAAMPTVIEAVKKVNSMKLPDIEKEFAGFDKKGYELKPKEKEGFLPKLDWAEKEPVITRYAPNPNGPFHLGNARATVLSDEFAKAYGGKMLLRFEDTDPKVKKPIKNAEKIFKEDLEWLGCKVSETFFASDRLETYYKYMRKLVEVGNAYVCDCKSEAWRELIKKKKACKCRDLAAAEQVKKFEKMLSHETKEGQAVLRIKTDLKHPDPSIRDWWIARIVDKPNHPRVGSKFHLWPSYMFQSAIDDHEMGVTLILRGQEHSQNQTKQEFLYKYLGWVYPHSFHFGRIKLGAAILSTSKISKGIEEGTYSGWDDPRLGTIRALRRRGFQAVALRQAILDVGVKSSDASIDMKKLADLNKDTVGDVGRIAFFEHPIQIDVSYAKKAVVEVNEQEFKLAEGNQKFVVDGNAVGKFKAGDVFRLRNAYNVKITKKDPLQVFAEFVGEAQTGKPILQWALRGVDVEIVMPDNTKKAGLAGEELAKAKQGAIVFLDKFGFCRVDSVGKKTVLWYAHA